MINGQKTTFWNFLKDFSISIPIIQRDYAQGRNGKEELRKRFVGFLKEAMQKKEDLNMDFVYGNFTGNTFYPLDGQQRLTTLWLLYWFIAYKSGKLSEAKNVLLKFSYATRVSSRDFCRMLCELRLPLPENTTILSHIRNQSSFFSSWEQDPTVQSMLRMISELVEQFSSGIAQNFDHLWNYLIGNDCKMEFRVLNIAELGQIDDLYVKMNARGKALTSFENFKAGLVDFIHKKANQDNDDVKKWRELDSVINGFGQKLDNVWTDIFWNLRSKDDSGIPERQNHIDEIFFAFFNRFFFNYQALHADLEDWKDSPLYGNSGKDEAVFFSSLKNYSIPQRDEPIYVPLDVFGQISTILNNWTKLAIALDEGKNPPLGPSWDKKSFFFLPEYEKNEEKKLLPIIDEDGNDILKITNIKVKQRAVFFAVCQWLSHNEPSADSRYYSQDQKEHFEDWMRVIWNIVENSETDNNLWGALNLINEMAENGSHDILTSLTSEPTKAKSNFAQDIRREEQLKAKIIVDERKNLRLQNISPSETLEYLIKSMESHPFIHGDIPVQIYMHKGENINREVWSKRHNNFVKTYLEKSGQLEQGKYQFSKDLLKHINDYKQLEFCFMDGSFLFNQTNYHRLIRHKDICEVIAEMLDGKEGCCFSWSGHETTAKRIFKHLANENTLDVFGENGYKETRLHNKWGRVYLHQKGAWYGFYLLDTPLYEILDSLEKDKKIEIPSDQKWSGIFNSNPVTFLFKGKKFRSDGITIWMDGCPNDHENLSSKDNNPICDDFLKCCQNIYDKQDKNTAVNQNDLRNQN